MHAIDTDRTARKRHVCACCGGVILPGTRHRELVSLGMDGCGRWRHCHPCITLAETAWDGIHDDEFWPDRALLWELREELRHSSDPILADLTSDDAWPNHPLPDELCARIRNAGREVWG